VTANADAPAVADEQRGDVTVLVVDDHAPFRLAVRALLRHLRGFTLVGEAETGEASVECFHALHPALVLMDINLPGISGIEAATRIRAVAPDAVVFLCSTYAREDVVPRLHASGAAAYVHKEELTAELLRALWAEHAPATRR
jgi:DNA-binding NarL/FixJ family response regulator